jgi:hypothetical protein
VVVFPQVTAVLSLDDDDELDELYSLIVMKYELEATLLLYDMDEVEQVRQKGLDIIEGIAVSYDV